MKKIMMISSVVLLAVGCSNAENEQGSNEATEVNQNNTTSNNTNVNEPQNEEEGVHNEQNDVDEVDNDTAASETNVENEGNEVEMEDQVEEEAETRYSLQTDHTVAPIDDAPAEVVLLTIDDAPDNYGVEMAEVLSELEVPAIFFVNGHFIQSDEGKQELQAIYDLGFEIGNHTMSHPNLRDISDEQVEEEIVQLNNEIEDIIGERPRFFRAPFGANSDKSEEVVEAEGMQSMNWTYGYDFTPEYMETEALGEIMVETELLRNGANLLMHDREFTLEALPAIAEGLREKGYEFVDPKELE
ncbi:polysaccharide deacetylase family protein [Paenalkalicoccus suaedae]|uniref:Polysaccharide deacetylase family protein n=1 Tax=Paenalkalicoccus suaedae TaxID=2592382 RepID=A0A859FFX1_9BACI|nr:polysaccharide deacetylase family protein [Paenalkalicoccus suaedae]QKS71572.1 polysaccharide deacetylase family protein [Paenalkalicoccus suaedae]